MTFCTCATIPPTWPSGSSIGSPVLPKPTTSQHILFPSNPIQSSHPTPSQPTPSYPILPHPTPPRPPRPIPNPQTQCTLSPAPKPFLREGHPTPSQPILVPTNPIRWELPDFGEMDLGHSRALGQHDAELLLSYLTVPYLRIPLVVSFFASDDRIHSLQVSKLPLERIPIPIPLPIPLPITIPIPIPIPIPTRLPSCRNYSMPHSSSRETIGRSTARGRNQWTSPLRHRSCSAPRTTFS